MKKLILGLLVFGFATQFMFTQVVELPEVQLDVNYKYLDAIESEDLAEAVYNLERQVAFYDIKESDFYREDYDNYKVLFFIPEGKIVAAYNKDGKITRTIERYKNIKLPKSVLKTITERYPKWNIVEDTYKVNFFDYSNKSQNKYKLDKEYKVKLERKGKKVVVKLTDEGVIL